MEIKLIVAYMPRDKLEKVEQALRRVDVERVDVSKVKGYGEYRNFFSADWMTDEVRIELVTRQHKVDAIVAAIMEGAHVAMPGAGVVAVLPVDELYLIRTGAKATPEEFWPKLGPEPIDKGT